MRFLGRLALLSLATIVLAGEDDAAAQPCNRQCDAAQRDANGCCPGAAPAPTPPPPRPPAQAAPPGGGGRFSDKCAASRECSGNLVCIDYRCQPPPSGPPPAPPPQGRPFDTVAASAALTTIASGVGTCQQPGGPSGIGHVTVTFLPSGSVVTAQVDQAPFAGTTVGGCVASRFLAAKIPPFVGANVPVGKSFTVTPLAPSPFTWVGIATSTSGAWATRPGHSEAEAKASALAACNASASNTCTPFNASVSGDIFRCWSLSKSGAGSFTLRQSRDAASVSQMFVDCEARMGAGQCGEVVHSSCNDKW